MSPFQEHTPPQIRPLFYAIKCCLIREGLLWCKREFIERLLKRGTNFKKPSISNFGFIYHEKMWRDTYVNSFPNMKKFFGIWFLTLHFCETLMESYKKGEGRRGSHLEFSLKKGLFLESWNLKNHNLKSDTNYSWNAKVYMQKSRIPTR